MKTANFNLAIENTLEGVGSPSVRAYGRPRRFYLKVSFRVSVYWFLIPVSTYLLKVNNRNTRTRR